MTPAQRTQRGEGKMGCVMSLLILAVTVTLAMKVIPVHYNNDRFLDMAEELAGRAGTMTQETLEQTLRNKAKELEIQEALAKGAVTVTIVSEARNGTCTIHLKYTRRVDFFGAYALPVETDKKIMKAFVDTR